MKELERLEQLFSKGQISRREFITRTAALGLTMAVSPMLFGKSSWAATRKRGGTFRLACVGGNTTDSLDPATPNDIMVYYVGFGMLRNNLTEVDNTAKPQPVLAESWEASPDAKKWTFELRKGVEFHNGKTLDAEDVVFSIMHHLKEGSKSAGKGYISSVSEIKADGKYTVIFNLTSGVADFAYILDRPDFQIVPAGTKDFEKGIGTGPFMLESYEPGVKAVAKRNPNYFKEGLPYFDRAEVIHIADANARTTALLTKKIDINTACDTRTYDRLIKTKDIEGVSTISAKRFVAEMRVNLPPYDNLDVRLGLKYALNREHVLDQLLQGHGVVGNDHPIPPNMQFFNSELPQTKYDPDKARFHIKKAGLLDNTFELHTCSQALPGPDLALLYAEHAKAAGIKIKVVNEAADGYWSDVWGKVGWFQSYWSSRATPDIIFTAQYAPESHWNATKWSNERFQKLLKASRAELDENKRREMYWEMQKLVHDLDGSVIYAFPGDLGAYNAKLGRPEKLAATVGIDGSKLFERWWWKA